MLRALVGVTAVLVLPLVAPALAAADTQSFTATGAEQTFVVPAGVTSVSVTAVGAEGARRSAGIAGGRGAIVTGTIATIPGQTLFVEVGTASSTAAGFNGGGERRGGGASDVRTVARQAAGSLDFRAVIAAGGGGGGNENAGGDADVARAKQGENGGTATASGPGDGGTGTDGPGTAGSAGSGGTGFGGASGGGGGLFGGGGGASDDPSLGSGGGGSSKVPPGGTKALAAAGTPASVTISYTLPVAPAPATQGPAPLQVRDTAAPKLSKLSLSPSSFVAANTGPAIAAAVGGRLSFRSSEAATATFAVQRPLKGRKKGKRCKVGRKKGKRCTTYRALRGSLSYRAKAGVNTFRFMGRVNGKSLKKGRYRLKVTAKDGSGNRSKPSYIAFRIK